MRSAEEVTMTVGPGGLIFRGDGIESAGLTFERATSNLCIRLIPYRCARCWRSDAGT